MESPVARRAVLAVGLGLALLLGGCGRLEGGAASQALVARIESESRSDALFQKARTQIQREFLPMVALNRKRLTPSWRQATFTRGDRHRKQVALTFDDGPRPATTPRLLQLLAKHQIPATFFVVGSMAMASPSLVKAEVAAGHLVGNHTYHHANLRLLGAELMATEIRACGDAVAAAGGKPPRYFRPPGGEYDGEVTLVAAALGYTTVFWTSDPGDYAQPTDKVLLDRLRRTVRPGGVVLLHDGPEVTLRVLPTLIAQLKAGGYQFVTVEELMRQTGR